MRCHLFKETLKKWEWSGKKIKLVIKKEYRSHNNSRSAWNYIQISLLK